MRLSIHFVICLLGWSRAADERCTTLVNFAETCISSTDDQFGELCAKFTTLQSEWCVEEGEFVIFYLDQASLVECKEPDGPLIANDYDEVERFKYQCYGDFKGPCNLLAQFEKECIEPLSDDSSSLTQEQFCELVPIDPNAPAVPSTCFTQAHQLFTLDQQYLSGCHAELADAYDEVERFKYQCATLTPEPLEVLPTLSPVVPPTALPTARPTAPPSGHPTAPPVSTPTNSPTEQPSILFVAPWPTQQPSLTPSLQPNKDAAGSVSSAGATHHIAATVLVVCLLFFLAGLTLVLQDPRRIRCLRDVAKQLRGFIGASERWSNGVAQRYTDAAFTGDDEEDEDEEGHFKGSSDSRDGGLELSSAARGKGRGGNKDRWPFTATPRSTAVSFQATPSLGEEDDTINFLAASSSSSSHARDVELFSNSAPPSLNQVGSEGDFDWDESEHEY